MIDKDFAAELLAESIDADMLLILTEVERVALNFNKPDQKELSSLTLAEAERYCAEGQFAPGSMLPKVRAAALRRGLSRTARRHNLACQGGGGAERRDRHGDNRGINLPPDQFITIFTPIKLTGPEPKVPGL